MRLESELWETHPYRRRERYKFEEAFGLRISSSSIALGEDVQSRFHEVKSRRNRHGPRFKFGSLGS
jgi:hypothetical protein